MFQHSLLTRIARSMVRYSFRTTTYQQLLRSKISANSLPLRCKNGMAVCSFLEKMWPLFLSLFNGQFVKTNFVLQNDADINCVDFLD